MRSNASKGNEQFSSLRPPLPLPHLDPGIARSPSRPPITTKRPPPHLPCNSLSGVGHQPVKQVAQRALAGSQGRSQAAYNGFPGGGGGPAGLGALMSGRGEKVAIPDRGGVPLKTGWPGCTAPGGAPACLPLPPHPHVVSINLAPGSPALPPIAAFSSSPWVLPLLDLAPLPAPPFTSSPSSPWILSECIAAEQRGCGSPGDTEGGGGAGDEGQSR